MWFDFAKIQGYARFRHSVSPTRIDKQMEAAPMPCEPISFDLQVDPPSDNTEIIFDLNKICNPDDTVEWKIHFELDQKNADGTKTSIVKFDLDINHEDAPAAAATAANGLNDDQRSQADTTAQTGLDVQTGDASEQDVKDQAAQVIPARNASSGS
jgi:hypothetical protein